MQMRKINYKQAWTVWSLDYLGNTDDGWEFNDRHPLLAFECLLNDGDDDSTSMARLLASLEEQDSDLCFTEAMKDGRIECRWEDEDNLYIYEKETDRPLFQIEHGFACGL